MHIVNNTDETIEVEPGEAITGKMGIESFEGKPYRVSILRFAGFEDPSDITRPGERYGDGIDD